MKDKNIEEVGLNLEEENKTEVEETQELLDELSDPEEERELTEEEKREIYIQNLKESRIRFQPTKHPVKKVGKSKTINFLGKEKEVYEKAVMTNVTENKYGKSYKEKRKKRKSLTKKSRKANR